MLPPPVHDPGAVRELADSILAEARYDRPPEPLPERILGWFADQIGKVLGGLTTQGGLGAVVAGLAIVAVVGSVIYLVARYGRISPVARAGGGAPKVMVELTRTPSEWRAEAEAHERAGRWAEGLRCRHRALVGELVRQGAIRDRAGRTAREHVGDVAEVRPAVAEPMAEATELFEAVWYGGAPAGPDEASRFEALADRVLDRRSVAR